MNQTVQRDNAAGNKAPISFETDIATLPITGALPEGLSGALVRNGPNPLLAIPGAHWFTGDGMLHAFHIEDGRVAYRNRWIRTAQWEHARLTGQPLKANELGWSSPSAAITNGGTANTNIIHHAGRMLALEEAHLPIAMDVRTLETLGATDFDGKVQHRFTAHPKTDPETGELLFFGYGTPQLLSKGMSFGTISREGVVSRYEYFDAPYASMVHDFAVTARHVVFPITPLTASLDRAKNRRPPFAWEPEFGTRVGIMPRNGATADLAWWSGPACYVFHVMNAWEDGDLLFVDVMQFDEPPLFTYPDGTPTNPEHTQARLVRWSFDLRDAGRTYTQTLLSDVPGEFPRIDERRSGLAYRHGWFAGHIRDEDGQLRRQAGLVHIDHDKACKDIYVCDGMDHLSEPVFVASSEAAAEGEGWIMATVWRAAGDTSDLLIFDALDVSAGPVCIASLPHRVPDGFHGNWFPAASN